MTVDISVLYDYHNRGLLKCQSNHTGRLRIWNYSERVQFSGALWDSVTTMCRALITDTEGNVVARSFPKFFNIGQLEEDDGEGDGFVVQAKMDGSLGVIFWDSVEDAWTLTSRGSFTSEQAVRGQRILNTMYDISGFDKDLAYSVEIIYPENRIVVDYGDDVKLVFLAAFYKDGTEAFPDVRGSGMPVVETYDYTDYKTIRAHDWTNCEGFVVRFRSSGKRIKIKFENYVRLHGLQASLSNITVWQKWSTGMPIADAIEGVPDELFDWFTGLWNGFDEAKRTITTQLEATYKELYAAAPDRKEFAKAVLGRGVLGRGSKLLFALYAGKSISSSVVDMVKPSVRRYAYE